MHRCTETDCPHFGQRTNSGCRCHQTDEQMLRAINAELLAAAEKALNYIANTEGELGITLDSGNALRAALASARGE